MTSSANSWTRERGEKWGVHLERMEATLKPIEEPFARALQLAGPCRIADVACGGGGTTIEIARRAPAGSVVHGFDISPVLIELARGRARSAQPRITFEVADLQTARPPESYMRLASRFGVMFFPDPAAAFANLFHWLAPGGRFVFAVWGLPEENPWEGSVRRTVGNIVPVPQPSGDEPGPFRYGDVDRLLALLRQAGYEELEVETWRGAVPIGGGLPAPDAAHFALASFSSFSEALAPAGPDAYEDAHRTLTATFQEHERERSVRMNACAHIVSGVRLK